MKSGPLGLGFTPYGGTHHFGPELQFGHVLGDAFKERVLLIKCAWGGKSLYRDFRPPRSGGAAAAGPYYRKMLADVREALAAQKERCEMAGFVWYQGWNDGVDPGRRFRSTNRTW